MTGYKESLESMYNDAAEEEDAQERQPKTKYIFPFLIALLVLSLFLRTPYNFIVFSILLFVLLFYYFSQSQ
jgi:hypothetical protein